MNNDNLVPLDTSVEKQRERARRPRQKGNFILSKKRNCNKRCPLFDRCLFQLESNNFEGKCGLANSDKTTSRRKHRIIRTLLGGRGEITNVLRELVVEMDAIRESKNFGELEKLFNNYIKLIGTEFGEKTEINLKGKIWSEKELFDKYFGEDEDKPE